MYLLNFLNSRFSSESFFSLIEVNQMKNTGLLWNIYATSSFSYLIYGLLTINWYSYVLVIQSILSFQNDVLKLGKKSIWHVLDKIYAPLNLILFSIQNKNLSKSTYVISILFYVISFYCILNKKLTWYLIMHSIWHIVPPILVYNELDNE